MKPECLRGRRRRVLGCKMGAFQQALTEDLTEDLMEDVESLHAMPKPDALESREVARPRSLCPQDTHRLEEQMQRLVAIGGG